MKREMKAVRIKQMERYIIENGFVSIEQLCEAFNISKNTARADVAELVEKGMVEKKYGGVEAVIPAVSATFNERKISNITAKEKIGREASKLLEEGDVVYIDSGTTTSCILDASNNIPENITIITNNFDVIKKAEKYPGMTVIVLAGKLERKTNSFIGVETIEGIRQFNFTKSFLGTTGVSEGGELSNSTLIEAKIKERVIQNSQETYLMADVGKVGKSLMVRFASLKNLNGWICDDGNLELVHEMEERLAIRAIISKKNT